MLGHVFVHKLAAESGIRALSIKGPVTMHHGLAKPYTPSDSDLLIEPDKIEQLCRLIESYGWVERVSEGFPRLLTEHSVSYQHPSWPSDLDIHHEFPGFLAPKSTTFDLLWERRLEIAIGNVMCPVVDRQAALVISMLHYERDSTSMRALSGMTALTDWARTNSVEPEDRRALVEILAQTGAMESLEAVARELGAYRRSAYFGSHELELWKLRSRGGLNPALPFIVALSEWRILPALRMVPSILSPRRPDFAVAGPSGLRFRIEHARRLIRSLRTLPRLIRVVRSSSDSPRAH